MQSISLTATLFLTMAVTAQAADPLNVLVITVDDMSADSIGAFGCQLAHTTPNIDRLAKSAMRFNRAHVVVANCMPSRNVLFSGLYPHNNRVEGFYQVPDANHPMLNDVMKDAGYFTAIRGKVSHSTPYHPHKWDLVIGAKHEDERGYAKDVASYKTSTEQGIRAAKEAGKSFYLVINIGDPHKPFYGEGPHNSAVEDPNRPSRVFTAEETPVPGFLYDDPAVREELARYYSTVRRADDCVSGILKALDDSGQADRTVVVFLSDHGMALPFAKTQLYHHSTHTPLIIRWPGITKPGSTDDEHLVSAVDFVPTICEVVGIDPPEQIDGRSFVPLLRGDRQEGRDFVIKSYHENSGGHQNPMRAIQTRDFLYIFNPWSNGKRKMATATTGTATYRRMVKRAQSDPELADRLSVFDHRTLEELYDIRNDPDCTINLIAERQHNKTLATLRSRLAAWMEQTDDPMLATFLDRDNPAALEEFMQRVEAEGDARSAQAKSKKKPSRRRARRAEFNTDGTR